MTIPIGWDGKYFHEQCLDSRNAEIERLRRENKALRNLVREYTHLLAELESEQAQRAVAEAHELVPEGKDVSDVREEQRA